MDLSRLSLSFLPMLWVLVTFSQSQKDIYAAYDNAFIEDVLQLEYNVGADRIMLKGYSPVSYVDQGVAEKGSPDFSIEYQQVIFLFTSEDQKQLFSQNPSRYMPAYGGYCAYGVAIAKHLDIDPQNFKMLNGRVHLFLRNNEVDALDLWNKGKETAMVEDAEVNWEILRLLPDED